MFTFYRVLSKQGSGLIHRTPHRASLIVHACAYLHNLAIDEGLAKITRLSQADPDCEEVIQRNALRYLLNAVKRNRHRVIKAVYRPEVEDVYLRGVELRNQILREQFRDRSIRIGPAPRPPRDGNQRRRGRPRTAPSPARRTDGALQGVRGGRVARGGRGRRGRNVSSLSLSLFRGNTN